MKTRQGNTFGRKKRKLRPFLWDGGVSTFALFNEYLLFSFYFYSSE